MSVGGPRGRTTRRSLARLHAGALLLQVFRRLRGAAAGPPRHRAGKRGRPRTQAGPGGARGARGTRMGIAFIPPKWEF